MLTNNRSMKRAIAALCVATLACSAVGVRRGKERSYPNFLECHVYRTDGHIKMLLPQHGQAQS